MSIEGKLVQMAGEAATRAQKRATHLRNEYLAAQKIAADKKAELDLANSALQRAAEFQVKIGVDYQCPICWINNGRRSALRSIPSQTRDDIFRCQYGHEHVVSY